MESRPPGDTRLSSIVRAIKDDVAPIQTEKKAVAQHRGRDARA